MDPEKRRALSDFYREEFLRHLQHLEGSGSARQTSGDRGLPPAVHAEPRPVCWRSDFPAVAETLLQNFDAFTRLSDPRSPTGPLRPRRKRSLEPAPPALARRLGSLPQASRPRTRPGSSRRTWPARRTGWRLLGLRPSAWTRPPRRSSSAGQGAATGWPAPRRTLLGDRLLGFPRRGHLGPGPWLARVACCSPAIPCPTRGARPRPPRSRAAAGPRQGDLLLVLLSGGASALLPAPVPGVSLAETRRR